MRDHRSLEPGRMVAPQVRLKRPLGRGGMGSVWVADHLRLDIEVAVKFIDPRLVAEQPQMGERFRREATAAAKIDSPHVVRTFDQGETDDGTPYIVMELLRGESLGQRLKREGRIGLLDTAVLVAQVCKLLRVAHALGIVHRDLKPANLFLVDSLPPGAERDARELFVKVLDFGIAKEVHGDASMTNTGDVLGTPSYMSREQLLSAKDVDLHADLWALAVVAYRCLTGQLPFEGPTPAATVHAICTGVFALPSQFLPGQPPALDGWFARALAFDPARRFASARELGDAFVSAVATATGRPPLDDPLRQLALDLPAAREPGPPQSTTEPFPPTGWRKPQAEPGTSASWSDSTNARAGFAPKGLLLRGNGRLWLAIGALAAGGATAALSWRSQSNVVASASPTPTATATATTTTTTTTTATATATATTRASTGPSLAAPARLPAAAPSPARPTSKPRCQPYVIAPDGTKIWNRDCL